MSDWTTVLPPSSAYAHEDAVFDDPPHTDPAPTRRSTRASSAHARGLTQTAKASYPRQHRRSRPVTRSRSVPARPRNGNSSPRQERTVHSNETPRNASAQVEDVEDPFDTTRASAQYTARASTAPSRRVPRIQVSSGDERPDIQVFPAPGSARQSQQDPAFQRSRPPRESSSAGESSPSGAPRARVPEPKPGPPGGDEAGEKEEEEHVERHHVLYRTSDPLYGLAVLIAGSSGRSTMGVFADGYTDIARNTTVYAADAARATRDIDDLIDGYSFIRAHMNHFDARVIAAIYEALARMQSLLTSSLRTVKTVQDILEGDHQVVVVYFAKLVALLMLHTSNVAGQRPVLQQNASLINTDLTSIIDALNQYERSPVSGQIRLNSVFAQAPSPHEYPLLYNFLY